MIKIEHIVEASPEQLEFVIEGMRNPLNSWHLADSEYYMGCIHLYLGEKDKGLMRRLCKAGTDHRKFMRMMPIYVRITAPLAWWKEFDTYKVGTVSNSTSTMHKIQAKEFTLDDFSHEHLNEDSLNILKTTIAALNQYRELFLQTKDKDCWWQMIELLPSSYNQTRNVMINYEVLKNMYHARKTHKLDDWRTFCQVMMHAIAYPFLIDDSDMEV